MAIFWRRDHRRLRKARVPEAADVVDDDDVGIEVDDPLGAGLEEVGEVVAGIVMGVLQGFPDRGEDEAANQFLLEGIDLEAQRREDRVDGAIEVSGGRSGGGDEDEEEGFGVGGMLEYGEDGGDRTAEIVGVEGQGDVDVGGVTGGGATTEGVGWAPIAVPKLGRLCEPSDTGGEGADRVGGRCEEEEEGKDES